MSIFGEPWNSDIKTIAVRPMQPPHFQSPAEQLLMMQFPGILGRTAHCIGGFWLFSVLEVLATSSDTYRRVIITTSPGFQQASLEKEGLMD